MIKDVFKEEQDTITENYLDERAVKSEITKKAKMWFTMNQLNNFK